MSCTFWANQEVRRFPPVPLKKKKARKLQKLKKKNGKNTKNEKKKHGKFKNDVG